jgi:hypothetical protein
VRSFVASLDRLDVSLLAIALVAMAGATVVECSGSTPVCGNSMIESGEQCDKGTQNGVGGSGCTATCQAAAIDIAEVQVFVTRLKDEVPGFDGSTCSDLGADKAHVVLAGPSPADELLPCTMNSKLYSNVTPGTYQATVTLLDASGNPLTRPVQSTMAEVLSGPMVTLSVNFHQSDFIKQDYVGVLDFAPSWEKDSQYCAGAGPPVTFETVTLKTPAGAPVTGMTSQGHKLDGTPGSCFTPSTTTPSDAYERVANLTWGHYDLTITGKVTGGAIGYCKKFDVFVGPGVSNGTYALVVDPANSDAGACP